MEALLLYEDSPSASCGWVLTCTAIGLLLHQAMELYWNWNQLTVRYENEFCVWGWLFSLLQFEGSGPSWPLCSRQGWENLHAMGFFTPIVDGLWMLSDLLFDVNFGVWWGPGISVIHRFWLWHRWGGVTGTKNLHWSTQAESQCPGSSSTLLLLHQVHLAWLSVFEIFETSAYTDKIMWNFPC